MRIELREGDDVTIHYLASTERGTIERIEGDGRTVVVVTQSDAVLEFHLMASAHYVTRDRAARLSAS